MVFIKRSMAVEKRHKMNECRARQYHDDLAFFFCVGYENQDWFIPSPALKPEDVDTAALSPDTIRETLNYFRKSIL